MNRMRKRLVMGLFIGLAGAVSLLAITASRAGTGTFVPFMTGFAGATGKGLQLPGGGIYMSSPTLADLNHDEKLEILIGSGRDVDGLYRGNGYLHAVSSTGTILWSKQGRPPSEIGSGEMQPPINSTPSVIDDLNGDGWDDVVVGLGGEVSAKNWDGGVAVFSGATGERLWIYNSDDRLGSQDDHWDGVFSTPAVGDVDGDGDQEIAYGGWDQCVYLLDHQGNPLWSNPILPEQGWCNGNHGYYNEDTVWSSPALADLDGDGKLEIIIGADSSGGNVFGDPAGGYLFVFRYDGTVLAREWMDEAIYSSPAVTDLNDDGTPEITVGTGLPFSNKGFYVTTWNYVPNNDPTQSLVKKWQGNTAGQVFTSPAVGDLDADGILDVVAISLNGSLSTCTGSTVYAWRGSDGTALSGFPVGPRTMSGNNDQCVFSSPVLADIDNDNRLEILLGNGWEVTIINHDGTQYTDSSPSGTKPTFYAYSGVSSSVAVGDLKSDGTLEVVAGGVLDASSPTNSLIGALKVWQTTASASKGRAWPMFHQNAQHTGLYVAPRLSVQPASLLALRQTGQTNPETTWLTLRNTGSEAFLWGATRPAAVTLSPSSGLVITTALVQVTIATTGHPSQGTYNLGNIIITGTLNGQVVPNSPVTLPVTLRVSNVIYSTHLPLLLKN